MTKYILSSLFVLNCLISVFGQSRDTGFHGATDAIWKAQFGVNAFWGGDLRFVEGRLSVGDGISYQFQIKRKLPDNRFVGVAYSFVPSELSFIPGPFYEGTYNAGTVDMNIHFLYTTATQYLTVGEIVSPFFDAGIGLAIYDPLSNKIDGRTHFLINMGLGTDIHMNSRMAIVLNGGLKMPIYSGGSGLYCGIGSSSGLNCGLSFDGSVLLAHWELGGAFVYSF